MRQTAEPQRLVISECVAQQLLRLGQRAYVHVLWLIFST